MTVETATTEAAAEPGEGKTLVTAGAQHEPDKGAGEKEPDKGAGEKEPDKAAAEGEAETDEQKATREAAEAEAAKAAEGAPEEYVDFKMPEGIDLDTDAATAFKAKAKELNLTQDQAQSLVDEVSAMRQREVDGIIQIRADWIAQTKADKEVGGDKFEASLATAKRALEAYGDEEAITLLNQTGLGNHPALVRLLARAGKSVSEDTFVKGRTAGDKPRTLAERLYSTSAKE